MKWVECPRDSWQGFSQFIPTQQKVAYLQGLLDAGFKHLDLTSFVSVRHVPQLADAEAVLEALPPPQGREYLAIVANLKGLERALQAPHLSAVAYPFSISPTFQHKNLNQTIAEAWDLLAKMQDLIAGRLKLVVHLSMAFGNPYGDLWSPELPLEFVAGLRQMGIQEIALADTYGVANASTIGETLAAVVQNFGSEHLGAHLHSRPEDTLAKVEAVLEQGVLWLEGALGGIGGCPFAGDELVGNLASELVLPRLSNPTINLAALPQLAQQAQSLRLQYA